MKKIQFKSSRSENNKLLTNTLGIHELIESFKFKGNNL